MSKEKKIFVAEKQYMEDFLRVVDIISGVLPVIKRLKRVEARYNEVESSIETLRQDVKNLKATEKIILDEEVAQYLKGVINEKESELNTKDSERKKIIADFENLEEEIKDYKHYAKVQKSFFDNTVPYIDIDFTQMSSEHIYACMLMEINPADFFDVSRVEVERQKVFGMFEITQDGFIRKLKEIL